MELLCEIDLGSPTAEVTWERQGRSVRTNDRVKSTITDHRVLLTIDDCNVEDVGSYKVRASNKLGTVETEANIDVKSMSTSFKLFYPSVL